MRRYEPPEYPYHQRERDDLANLGCLWLTATALVGFVGLLAALLYMT